MLARQIRRLRPGLVLLQHPDDLIFREPRSLHLSVLQEARTLNPRGGKSQREVTSSEIRPIGTSYCAAVMRNGVKISLEMPSIRTSGISRFLGRDFMSS